MKSRRQKELKQKTLIFGIISWASLFTLLTVYLISAFANFNAVQNGVQVFTDEAKKIVISMSITAIIGIIATIFLKEGMRTFIWIVCVILGSLVYKEVGMYIALGTWLIDDYVIHKLFLYYKNKLSIRKEIDYEVVEPQEKEKEEIEDGDKQE